MNTFMNGLTNATNYKRTENGTLAHKSTNSAVYDMFAFGGAYRSRTDADCILLFKNAFEEDETLALKCLFYLRDCRGGQGERRFFRVCFNWLIKSYPEAALRNLNNIAEYGRWDDLVYTTMNTALFTNAMDIVDKQLRLDLDCKTPSLLGKWMPSENASSTTTKQAANRVRNALGMSHKGYRQMLSILRKRINIVERLMSNNEWDKIEFDKIPSKAGLIYKNAFARRDILAKKYEAFMKSDETKVNASTLYPYEIVQKATQNLSGWGRSSNLNDVDRAAINQYWANLPDYFEGKKANMICVVDTSGSMWGNPINVAISLGLYCAERLNGPFKDHYISFASRPQLIKTNGIDFVDKVERIYRTNLCDNTNLTAVFDLLKSIALKPEVRKEDIPEQIVVISDMEIDNATGSCWGLPNGNRWTKESAATEMEKIRRNWAAVGLELPKLVYWNVNARNDTILDAGPNVSFVSGCSPVIFKQVITGVTGFELMLKTLMDKRYDAIN